MGTLTDMVKTLVTSILGMLKSTILGFSQQYGDFVLIGLALLFGFLLYKYTNEKNKMRIILISSTLIYIILVLL